MTWRPLARPYYLSRFRDGVNYPAPSSYLDIDTGTLFANTRLTMLDNIVYCLLNYIVLVVSNHDVLVISK